MPKIAENRPFKAKINGNSCILVVNDDSFLAKFEKFQKSFKVFYDDMRFIEYTGDYILINMIKNDGPMAYKITSSAAKKIYNEIMSKIK